MRVTVWWGRRGSTLPLDLTHRCPRCGSAEHGVPFVRGRPDLAVSVTHSGDHTAVAWAEGADLGIDAEPADVDVSGVGPVLLSRFDQPTDDPTTLRRVWVRKEAVLKALGTGLMREPSNFAVSSADAPPAVTWWDTADDHPEHVRLIDLAAEHGMPDGQVASLAVITDRTVTIEPFAS